MAVAQQPTNQQAAMQPNASVDEATLRRVAIVLGGLPAHMASRLMSSLSTETKSRLRDEIRQLADVDPLERHRAYQAFKGSYVRQTSALHDGSTQHRSAAGDTFVSASSSGPRPNHGQSNHSHPNSGTSRVYRMDKFQGESADGSDGFKHASATSSNRYNDNSTRPEMTFLGDIEDDVLARVIQGEHPQAIAFVLASIAPAQAARIVSTLDPKLQSEALNRIARLDEASSDAIADFVDHLRKKVERFGANSFMQGGTAGGRNALQAILDAMPNREGAESANRTPVQTSSHSDGRDPVTPIAGHAAMIDEVMSPRIARDTVTENNATSREMDPAPSPNASHAGNDSYVRHESMDVAAGNVEASPIPVESVTAAQADGNLRPAHIRPFESTDEIHQHLIKLKPRELCAALAEVDTRQALLTLCGLPNHVAEKVMSALPRGQAKQVRARLAGLGSLQLREIDEAKEQVALISIGFKPNDNGQASQHDALSSTSDDSVPVAA